MSAWSSPRRDRTANDAPVATTPKQQPCLELTCRKNHSFKALEDIAVQKTTYQNGGKKTTALKKMFFLIRHCIGKQSVPN